MSSLPRPKGLKPPTIFLRYCLRNAILPQVTALALALGQILVVGTPLTLRIGFIAGFIGVGLGAVLAFVAAYYRGIADTVIRGIADIGLTVPGLLVLILGHVEVHQRPRIAVR